MSKVMAELGRLAADAHLQGGQAVEA